MGVLEPKEKSSWIILKAFEGMKRS